MVTWGCLGPWHLGALPFEMRILLLTLLKTREKAHWVKYGWRTTNAGDEPSSLHFLRVSPLLPPTGESLRTPVAPLWWPSRELTVASRRGARAVATPRGVGGVGAPSVGLCPPASEGKESF